MIDFYPQGEGIISGGTKYRCYLKSVLLGKTVVGLQKQNNSLRLLLLAGLLRGHWKEALKVANLSESVIRG